MEPDDKVCLCFHVSQRKIVNWIKREDPPVASLISECLGAGTGCGWCVPFLCRLHDMHKAGQEPDLPFSPEEYANRRQQYRSTGKRPGEDDDVRPDDPTPSEEQRAAGASRSAADDAVPDDAPETMNGEPGDQPPRDPRGSGPDGSS